MTRLRSFGLAVGIACSAVASRDARAQERAVEEIIVTANRRAENVQDMAGGIRVLGGEALEQAGAAGFADYAFTVPGTDVLDSGLEKRVAIRGIANLATFAGIGFGSSASPIGIYLDDTPIQGNGVLPDLDLYDLERIEVLKGPQGTLYGEGAQGGAIKMLLHPAVAGEFSVKAETGVGETYNGSGLNNFQKIAVNAPLMGSWAARLVGTRRLDQGFVDFPNRGTEGEDDAENLMGRVHLNGEIREGFEASALFFYQRQEQDQFPTIREGEPDLESVHYEPEFADTDFKLGALTLDYDLGFATLTSSTSAFWNDREALLHFPSLGIVVQSALVGFFGGDFQQLPPIQNEEWAETTNEQNGIAQELRLVSNDDSLLRWIGGFYYRQRDNDFQVFASTTTLDEVPPPAGPGLTKQLGTESFEQVALFGEASVDLPWRFELGAGLRGFREEVALDGEAFLLGPLFPVAVALGHPDGSAGAQSFDTTTTAVAPKVALKWFADDFRMLYFQAAKGVRSGGTNANALLTTVTPLFDPDVLWAYEVGAKTTWLDGRLTANLSLFYNDWNDLQIFTNEPGTTYRGTPVEIPAGLILNAASAYSRGVELELLALPIEDATLGFNLFVGEGEISEGDPAGNIPDHTPLPHLGELGYSAFASYVASRWPILGFTPHGEVNLQSTDDRPAFTAVNGNGTAVLDGFQTYNALVGVANERWEVTFGVRNLTDERPELGATFFEPDDRTIGRPRTWTARLAVRF